MKLGLHAMVENSAASYSMLAKRIFLLQYARDESSKLYIVSHIVISPCVHVLMACSSMYEVHVDGIYVVFAFKWDTRIGACAFRLLGNGDTECCSIVSPTALCNLVLFLKSTSHPLVPKHYFTWTILVLGALASSSSLPQTTVLVLGPVASSSSNNCLTDTNTCHFLYFINPP